MATCAPAFVKAARNAVTDVRNGSARSSTLRLPGNFLHHSAPLGSAIAKLSRSAAPPSTVPREYLCLAGSRRSLPSRGLKPERRHGLQDRSADAHLTQQSSKLDDGVPPQEFVESHRCRGDAAGYVDQLSDLPRPFLAPGRNSNRGAGAASRTPSPSPRCRSPLAPGG